MTKTFNNLVVYVCVFIFMFTLAAPYASGISADQRRLINSGVRYYDLEESRVLEGGTGAGAGCYTIEAISINDPHLLAEAINEYVEARAPSNSPLLGLGELFVSGAQRAEINPFFVVTIAQKESSFGTAGVATNGSNNAFGRTATESQPHIETNRRWYAYDSFAASLDGNGEEDQPTYMARVFKDEGLTSIEDVMNVYAPPSENNTALYVEQMRGWIDDLIDRAGVSINCGSSDGWIWPHESPPGTVTSCFGPRRAPTAGASTNHPGVDIAAGTGTAIYAAAAGEVVTAGRFGSAGLMIVIQHHDGERDESLRTRYLHNSTMHVRTGESVQAGQHIADEGATGNVTGAHLHFEIERNGAKVNPFDEITIPDGVTIRGSNCTSANTGGQM